MEVYSTKLYDKWFEKLKDKRAKAKIDRRLHRIRHYNSWGDCETVSKNVSEIKIDYGPGYRIYFTKKEGKIIILLVGGDKSTQTRDIKKAEKTALIILIKEVAEWF